MTLVQEYRALINKHHAAVQTDTALGYDDDWKIEKKAKKFWAEFHAAESNFLARLEAINA